MKHFGNWLIWGIERRMSGIDEEAVIVRQELLNIRNEIIDALNDVEDHLQDYEEGAMVHSVVNRLSNALDLMNEYLKGLGIEEDYIPDN